MIDSIDKFFQKKFAFWTVFVLLIIYAPFALISSILGAGGGLQGGIIQILGWFVVLLTVPILIVSLIGALSSRQGQKLSRANLFLALPFMHLLIFFVLSWLNSLIS